MTDAAIADINADLKHFVQKTQQVQRMYGGLWEDRLEIYVTIMSALKKGRGWFSKAIPDIRTGFAHDLKRLAAINKNERWILTILRRHESQNHDLLWRFETTLRNTPFVEGNLYDASGKLTQLFRLVREYFEKYAAAQEQFLDAEERFTADATMETLQTAYCQLKGMELLAKGISAQYARDTQYLAQTLDAAKAIDKLEADIIMAMRSQTSGSPLNTALGKLLEPVRRVRMAKPHVLSRRYEERLAFMFAKPVPIVIQILLRMAIEVPILLAISDSLWARPDWHGGIGIIRYDFYLFLIGYLALGIELSTGFIVHGGDLLSKGFATIQRRLGTQNPFDFTCAPLR